ncbi:MAG: hypothetical protein AAF492_31915, partial [Verrucomicrobiota bacterium]
MTDTNGVPLAGIDIDVLNSNNLHVGGQGVVSGPDGRYVFGPAPAGRYLVRADPGLAGGLIRTWYSNAALQALAQPVDVVEAGQTTNINFVLRPGWNIIGFVRDEASRPVENVDIDLFTTNGIKVSLDADTAVNGSYIIGPLLPGFYLLHADPPDSSGLGGQYYVNGFHRTDATPVEIVSSLVFPINFVLGSNLPPVAAIQPFGGISSNQFVLDASASSDPNGDSLTFAWSLVSGPPVGFDDDRAVAPLITLPTNGAYVIQLIASDAIDFSDPLLIPIVNGPIQLGISQTTNLIQLQWTLGVFPQPYAVGRR